MKNKEINSIKRKVGDFLYKILAILALWIAISTMIQAVMCNRLTQTELFLKIPKSFVCEWEYCE